MNWLTGRKSKLAVENKILIYKAIIIPIWTYGASKSISNPRILRMTVKKKKVKLSP
jgi:hypothetical protein